MGLIQDIPSCADLIKRVEKEAEVAIQRMSSLIIPQSKL